MEIHKRHIVIGGIEYALVPIDTLVAARNSLRRAALVTDYASESDEIYAIVDSLIETLPENLK